MSHGDYYDDLRERRSKGRGSLGVLFNALMLIISVLAGIVLLLTLIAPYIHPASYWIFPILGLFAPGIWAAVAMVALYWICCWRWRVAGPLVLLLVIGALKMPLFLRPQLRRHYATEQRASAGTLTVMSYNVRGFRGDEGQDTRGDVAALVRRIAPDVLCLQECNLPEDRCALDSLLEGYIRTGSGLSAVYARFEPLGHVHRVLYGDRRSGQSEWVDLTLPGDTLRVWNNHLHTTTITGSDDRYLTGTEFLADTAGGRKVKNIFRRFRASSVLRACQADTIARAHETMPATRAMVVCGDFNDTPLSYTYRRVASGLADAFAEQGKGYSHTFREFMRALRIDYVLFNTKRMQCTGYEVLTDVDYSDHYPVVARFTLKK